MDPSDFRANRVRWQILKKTTCAYIPKSSNNLNFEFQDLETQKIKVMIVIAKPRPVWDWPFKFQVKQNSTIIFQKIYVLIHIKDSKYHDSKLKLIKTSIFLKNIFSRTDHTPKSIFLKFVNDKINAYDMPNIMWLQIVWHN